MLRIAAVQLDYLPGYRTSQHALWVPHEPLLGVDPISGAPDHRAASTGALFEQIPDQALRVRRDLEQVWIDAARSQLEQILNWCAGNSVDLCVFPEYSIPAACLDVLVNFSDKLAVASGVGLVRAEDVHWFETAGFVPPRVNSSVGVFLDATQRLTVAKRHPAEMEVFSEGQGATIVEATMGGRTYTVGLALCMDYIHAGHTFDSRAADLDVVAIMALSANTDEFAPKKQRDYVRILANAARYGGTAIGIEHIQGSDFVTSNGTLPMPPGPEGVVVVDMDRAPRRRTSTIATRNALHAYAQIVGAEQNSDAADIVRQLGRLNNLEELPVSSLDRWLDLVGDHPELAVLRASLSAARRHLLTASGSQDIYRYLSSHLAVAGTQDLRAQRARQVGVLIAALKHAPGFSDDPDLVEVYKELLAMKRVHRGAQMPQVETEQWFVLRCFSLGRYNREKAIATLPAQLSLLRAIARQAKPQVGMFFRLKTAQGVMEDDVRAHFEVGLLASGRPDELEALSEELGSVVATVFVDGWSLSGGRAEVPDGLDLHWDWIPVQDRPLPDDHHDWSGVVDVLRSLTPPLCVQLNCFPTGDGEQLRLSIRLGAASDVPELVRDTVLSLVTGPMGGTWQSAEASGWPSTRDGLAGPPDKVINLFHPPDGRVQGRGIGLDRHLNVPISGVTFPVNGVVLGHAQATSARFDHPVDVRLGPEDRLRHLYVVGKTGSGKSNLLKHLIRQDLAGGSGFAVIDPHGGLVDYAVRHARDQIESGQVIVLDFGRRDLLPVLNPLELDIHSPSDLDLAIEEAHQIITHRIKAEYAGPVFEDMFRLSLETLVSDSFPTDPSVLLTGNLWRDDSIRTWLAKLFQGQELGARWDIYNRMGRPELADHTKWMLAKFAQFSRQGVLRGVWGGAKSTLSLEEVVYGGKVLLVKLPEAVIGTTAASFIGSFIVSRIRRALFDPERAVALGYSSREPFMLYVDEFQKFVTGGFEDMFAEARKFGLGIVVAHQNLRQLTAFSVYENRASDAALHSVLGNVGSLAVMRVGSMDAGPLGKELGVRSDDLLQVGQYEALARVVVDGAETQPFTVTNSDAENRVGDLTAAQRAADLMVERGIWVDRESLESRFETSLSRFKEHVDKAKAAGRKNDDSNRARSTSFLDDWLEKRNSRKLLSTLQAVDGIGERTAGRIADKYADVAVLRKLSPEELAASIPRLGVSLAAEALKAVEAAWKDT